MTEAWKSIGPLGRVLVVGLIVSLSYLLTVLVAAVWKKLSRGEEPGSAPSEGDARWAGQPDSPAYRLYSEAQIVASTIFFTPLVGALLLQSNLRKLGNSRKAWLAVLFGIAVTAGLLGIGIALQVGKAGHVGGLEFLSASAMHWAFKHWLAEPM